VRSESIKPATLVYLDIAVDFLVRLHPGTTSWTGGENYDWLKKYGIPNKFALPEEIRPRIAEGLRAGLPLARHRRYSNRLGNPPERSD
jgi:hypothetical protein